MPFVDRPLPASFDVPAIVSRKPGRGGNHPPRKKKGAIAKITRDIKAGILEGAIAHGSDGEGTGGLTGYFEMCAAKYPKAYMHLLGKLMPIQLHGEGLSGPSITSVNIVSIPSGEFLSAADMERLSGGAIQAIEQVPQAIEPEPVPEMAREPASESLTPQLAALEAKLAARSRAELLRLAGVTDDEDERSAD